MLEAEKIKDSTNQDAQEGRVDNSLKVEFSTRPTKAQLMDFKLYHNYHSISGIAGLLFGIIAGAICVLTIKQVNISYTLMMGFFALFFTIGTPIRMYASTRKQIKKSEKIKESLTYIITEDNITLKQGEIEEQLLWDDVFKIKFTGKNIILYITAVRANIIPVDALGNQAELFFQIADKKLKPFQIKLNKQKVINIARSKAR